MNMFSESVLSKHMYSSSRKPCALLSIYLGSGALLVEQERSIILSWWHSHLFNGQLGLAKNGKPKKIGAKSRKKNPNFPTNKRRPWRQWLLPAAVRKPRHQWLLPAAVRKPHRVLRPFKVWDIPSNTLLHNCIIGTTNPPQPAFYSSNPATPEPTLGPPGLEGWGRAAISSRDARAFFFWKFIAVDAISRRFRAIATTTTTVNCPISIHHRRSAGR